ncbi:MAG: hypothetical protein AAF628_17445 [Planctomycetota bacterium]
MATPPDQLEFDVPATCAHLGPGFGVLGVAVGITLHVTAREGSGARHAVEWRGSVPDVAVDPRHDVIARGISAARDHFGIKMPDALEIVADTKIPPASGLGTQTAGFAAGVGIATRYAKKPPPTDEILDLVVELGGDPAHAAAALIGGLAAAAPTTPPSAGLHFSALAHPLHEGWQFVIACPAVRVATADARRILPPTLPHGAVPRTVGRTVGLLRALADGNSEGLAGFLHDEVHVPFRRRLVPGIEEAMGAAREAGAAGVTISGHGPGIVALTTDSATAEPIAAAMVEGFASQQQEAHTLIAGAATTGALS